MADDGLTLHHHAYTLNLAHAWLLGIENPHAAAGKVFNAVDEEVLTVRQVVELIAVMLGHELEDRVDAVGPRTSRAVRCSRSPTPPIACSTSRGSSSSSTTATPYRPVRPWARRPSGWPR